MTKKHFVKQAMSCGISRNEAIRLSKEIKECHSYENLILKNKEYILFCFKRLTINKMMNERRRSAKIENDLFLKQLKKYMEIDGNNYTFRGEKVKF